MTTTASATTFPVPAPDPTPRLTDIAVAGSWKGRLSTDVAARDFTFTVAEPTPFGGTDEAPNPIEYLLGSLSGCVSVVVETVAAELGVDVAGLDTRAEGTIDLRGFAGTADVSPHFQELTLTLGLTTDADGEVLAELQRRVLARCPVFNLVRDAGIAVREVWEVRRAS